jgi:hypothetical protein
MVVNDVGGAAQTVLLAGQGLAAVKAVSFSVADLTFPDTALNLPPQSAPIGYLYVYNVGTAVLNVESVGIAGPDPHDFQIIGNSCNATSIGIGGSCYVSVSFDPSATGLRGASLQVFDDAPGGMQAVPLAGAGEPPMTSLQLFPTAVAFAPTGTASSEPAQITIQNNGSEPVTINGVLVTGPNATDFLLSQNDCQPIPYTLAVGGGCYLEMLFTPGAVGARLANLEIVDSAAKKLQIVPLEGSGVVSTISLDFSPNPVVFNLTTVGQTYYGSFALQNLGSGTAQISLQVSGIDASDFFLPYYCNVLGPGEYCYMQLNFTPSAPGIPGAALVATDSVPGQSQSVLLTGSDAPAGTPLGASGPSFPPVLAGTATQGSLTVYNESASPVTITQLTLTGGAKSDFGILDNNCPVGSALNPGYSCTVLLTFTPSAANTRIAQINIAYSGGSAALSLPLAGTGLPVTRTISFNPSSVDFSAVQLGTPQTYSPSIYNAGNDP